MVAKRTDEERVEDFRHVADYQVTRPYVGENRIGVLGICGGGGYSINAAMTERRIKAVGTIRVRRNSGISFRLIEDASFEILSEMLHPTGFEADGVFPRNLC